MPWPFPFKPIAMQGSEWHQFYKPLDRPGQHSSCQPSWEMILVVACDVVIWRHKFEIAHKELKCCQFVTKKEGVQSTDPWPLWLIITGVVCSGAGFFFFLRLRDFFWLEVSWEMPTTVWVSCWLGLDGILKVVVSSSLDSSYGGSGMLRIVFNSILSHGPHGLVPSFWSIVYEHKWNIPICSAWGTADDSEDCC